MPQKMSDIWWLFSRQTVSVTQNESILKAARLMVKRGFRHLPVVDGAGRAAGLVSAQDVIDSLHLVLRPRVPTREVMTSLDIPVERIMIHNVLVVEQGDGLAEVVKKFETHNLGSLLVVDDRGVVQGIVTLRDLVGMIGISSTALNVPVSEVMTTNVKTIQADSSILDAVKLMSENRVRRLPIVSRDSQLVGVVTSKDVLRHVSKVSEDESTEGQFDLPVSQLMTKEVMTIGYQDDVQVAASQMAIFSVGGLVIADLPTKELALVTERDLVRRLSAKRGVNFLVDAMQYEMEAEPSIKSG